jgi:hypothetical protein
MDRTGYSNMGLTQANTSKQDESRSLAAVPMVDGGGPDGISHCDPHVPASAQASLRAHRLWEQWDDAQCSFSLTIDYRPLQPLGRKCLASADMTPAWSTMPRSMPVVLSAALL